MAAEPPDDVPDLRPPPSPWRYLAYPVLVWAAVVATCRLLFALFSYEAPYAWAVIILAGFVAALAVPRTAA